MRIGGHHEADAAIASEPGVDIVQVEPFGLTVDFERYTEVGGGGDDPVHANSQWVPLQQPSPGRVSEHVHPRTFERAEHAIGDLFLTLRELRVHGDDHEIELREAISR